MKSCLIFVTLFFVCSLFEKSMGCQCDPLGIIWPCPNCETNVCRQQQLDRYQMDWPKITLNIEFENTTPDCKEGVPCLRQADCGNNGECVLNVFKSGYIIQCCYISTYLDTYFLTIFYQFFFKSFLVTALVKFGKKQKSPIFENTHCF